MTIDITDAVGKHLKTELGTISLTRFLGRGKSGYSYLGILNKQKYAVKLMHNEPCSYYSFGETNKVEHEINSYRILESIGLTLPKLKTYDVEKGFLVKEYIGGILATTIIANGEAKKIIEQLYQMSLITRNAGINIDYFPANFVVQDFVLYYIDYEHNQYSPQWDLANWGIYYWANSEGMRQYLRTGDISALNESMDSGIPIKEPLESIVAEWNTRFNRSDLSL